MYLKTLTVRGFKSFASATTLHLEPGITCVVGPNGSGKSNVVDALTWVMGEQGAKNLRGGQMADVIFAGTSQRAALGRAQVSLTIDNSDGLLPIEYSEVTISRTLFRGGGSEYSINNTPCRLLDIQELLSDTGMGRQMHVIIGQGQLDTVLAAGADERRGFIEEAAGVLKHRRRKERALKKLTSMESNLVRVKDLVGELQRQLRPLARQAEAARRAEVVQAELRDAGARLLADDLAALQTKLVAAQQGKIELLAQITEFEKLVKCTQTDLAQAEEQSLQATPRIGQLTDLWRELNTVCANLNTLSQVASERLRGAQQQLAAPNVDLTQLEQRVQQANQEDGELLQAVEAAQLKLKEAITFRESSEAKARVAQEAWKQALATQATQKERMARLHGEVRSAQQRVAAQQAEIERLEESIKAARERLELARQLVAELPQLPAEGESEVALAHQTAGVARDSARDLVDKLLRAERDARSEQATWVARRDTLAGALAPEDETALLLSEADVLGTLAQFVKVQPGYENQVAVALAGLADAAVTGEWQVALQLVQQGVSKGAGSQRLVVSDFSVGSVRSQVDLAAKQILPEGAVWALSVVECTPGVQTLVEHLLADCVLVGELSAAENLLSLPGVGKVITASGIEVTPYSIATGRGATVSVLQRQADFEYASTQATLAAGEVEKIENQLQQARRDYDLKVSEANRLLKELRETDAQRAKLVEERAKATSQERAVAGELSRLEAMRLKLQSGLESAQEAEVVAQSRLVQAEQIQQDTGEEQVVLALVKAEETEAAAVKARSGETQLRLEIRTLEEQSNRAKDRARSLRAQLGKAREEELRYQRQEAKRKQRLLALTEVQQKVQAPLHLAQQALAQAVYELEQAQAQRNENSEHLGQLRKTFEAHRQSVAELKEVLHRGEISLQELQLRFDHLAAEGREAFALEAEELLAQFGPEQLVEADEPYPYVRAEQEARLAKARKALERLGKVNPLALEEYEALQTRHTFLQEQLRDLQQSKADLLEIVAEVDTRVQEVFAQAFADVQKSFAHVFATLFPGGKGKLTLTDPDDLLNTGVEIEARPAGKKITRLSLLSGGERSLAAIALLVAIFKARPSPFYVMDEVEAALDDVNLSRLLEIFKELQLDSQLIIITHQKRTMQIADALYGVTMRDGVSQVVSSRLNEDHD
ncbi:chromosome segregation protein SMC [Gleimia sp. 6138-11-ORH1]|uniref:chromosome segregation protein SMC n=1 Tax=Gleimia sp. 6138-11-ORH1 TaxID=2973937 RepID=UPI0021689121|nr:chromosome segregation protein SMC [Gleimia sp. 6138-11-ORH1]MCS4484879.1 chromosome segregation protein SMC [Gleimia sp. 6138-11-ORH1]